MSKDDKKLSVSKKKVRSPHVRPKTEVMPQSNPPTSTSKPRKKDKYFFA